MKLVALLIGALIASQAAASYPTFVSTTTGSNASNVSNIACTDPSGTVDLDVALITMMDDAGVATKSINVPSGWVELDQHFTTNFGTTTGASDIRASLQYRIRTGAESGSTTWTYDGGSTTGQMRCTTAGYVNASGAPLDVTFVGGSHRVEHNQVSDNTNWTAGGPQPITTVTARTTVVALQYRTNNGTLRVAPTGYTIRADQAATNRAHLFADRAIAGPGTETPGAWGTTGLSSAADALDYTIAIRGDFVPMMRRRR